MVRLKVPFLQPSDKGGPAAIPTTSSKAADMAENVSAGAQDSIEEYDFSNEMEDVEDDDDGRDTEAYRNSSGVITIPDDDEEDQFDTWQPNHRPWLAPGFTLKHRVEYETMYSTLTNYPMGREHDWEITEEYQLQKDKEMGRYIEDFPLLQWVIPQQRAQEAYNLMIERRRWRGLGIRIFGSRNFPQLMPGAALAFQSVNNQPMQVLQPQLLSQPQSFQTMRQPHQQIPQQFSQRPMPHGTPNGRASHGMLPPPMHVLRSQPNAQPTPTYPNGVPMYSPMAPGMPVSMPQRMANTPMANTSPVYGLHGHQIPPSHPGNKGKAREKKSHTPPAEPPPLPPRTPPYEVRGKPTERKAVNKSGRRNIRRQAEAEVLPWNRQMDFKVARANATWDDSIYDQSTLTDMDATRAKNESIIQRLDSQETDRQRQLRNAKKKRTNMEGSSDVETSRRQSRTKTDSPVPRGSETRSDPYHSGSFCFATEEDHQVALALSKSTPDNIIEAYEAGTIRLRDCAQIKVCWNPGKRGITQDLEQARFTIKDTLITRQQLENTPILTRRAAECIVDFCPDLLWRDILLRIASETGFGNKDIRDRMCRNGSYVDKATITKRIGAALGQKQQQSTAKNRKKPVTEPSTAAKNKGYAEGEDTYYENNTEDYKLYTAFFGKRTSHRGQVRHQTVGTKRKLFGSDGEEGSSAEDVIGSPAKRAKGPVEATHSPEAASDTDETTAATPGSEMDTDGGSGEDNVDAVSVQSDTLLDEMDED